MVKISVIVPVYNVEQYLARCLESLINQTLKEIEIICIDDGSKDSSAVILENYAQKDERIKIINQNNFGLSVTRNNGLVIAQGEFISFVDSDDYLSLDFYEKLYNSAINNKADIAVAGIKRLNDNYCIDMLTFEKEECTSDFEKKVHLCNVPDSCQVWNKIYNRNFLINSGIKFVPNRIYEDIPFTAQILYYSKNLVTVPETYYFYWRSKNTIVKKNNQKASIDFRLSEDEAIKFFSERGFDYFENKTIIKKFKLCGVTLYKAKTKNKVRENFLLNFIRWKTHL